MRTVVIAVVILFMAAFFGCGVASADVDWDQPGYQPVLPDSMQQFLQTPSQWEPAPNGTLRLWRLPPTAPPLSEWAMFTKAACSLAGNYFPARGEKWATEKLVSWGKAGKFLAPVFGKSVEVAVDTECPDVLDNAKKLVSHAWTDLFG